MLILTIRTDKPEAEIGLFNDRDELGYEVWMAHRQLAESLHTKIKKLLSDHAQDWSDISGVVVYRGPGSFTGLRIGITVANTIADINKAAIIGSGGDNWLSDGILRILSGGNDINIVPEYGAPVHITQPKR